MVIWAAGILTGGAWAQNQTIDPFSMAGQAGGAGGPAGPARLRVYGNIRSVQFVDTAVTDIFTMISDLTGWSIMMSPEVSKTPPRINIWIKDLPPDEVLEKVVAIAGLVMDRRGEVYNILTFDEFVRLNGVEKKVLPLKHANAEKIVDILKPFAQREDHTRITSDTSTNQVILLVPAPLMESFENLVRILDVPFEKEVVEVVRLKYLSAEFILPELNTFLKGVSRGSGPMSALKSGQPQSAAVPQTLEDWMVQFMMEPRLNVIVLRGLPDYVQHAAELIRQLDVEYEQDSLKIVPLQYQEAQQLVSALEEFLGRSSQGYRQEGGSETQTSTPDRLEVWPIRFLVDTKFNAIILRGKPHYIERALALINELDKDPAIEIRSYTLKYTMAENVYRILREVVHETELTGQTSGESRTRSIPRLRIAANPQNNNILIEGSPRDHGRFEAILKAIDVPMPPGSGGMRVYRLENTSSSEVAGVLTALVKDRNELAKRQKTALDKAPSAAGTVPSGLPSSSPTAPQAAPASSPVTQEGYDILPAVITEAPEINAVIISASAVEHEEFASIIEELDKPRDQVVLEVTLVSIQNIDSFRLGVEVGGNVSSNKTEMIGFSNFGIGVKDTATGTMTFPATPAFGLNTAIFHSDDFSLVLNALKTIGKTRITSSPKVLVENNASGFISQTTEEPYAVVSQTEGSTITSFGGFVEAGTILQVIPRITDGEWLRLEYQIQLSSFGTRTAEQAQANLPPSREKNIIQGSVRIPEGNTIVLGGLVNDRQDDVRQGIPLLADIPILGHLFGDNSRSSTDNTLFIFIRPQVMRDPQYRDLLRLSKDEAARAKIELRQEPVNPMMFMVPPKTEDTL
jgi:general secretion pathway protein D